MTLIRHIEIENFRSIRRFKWFPATGINCLVGPGDSGKSTVLDAIDLCLGARRNFAATDSDFYQLDPDKPVRIRITLGELDPALMGLEAYGVYLRGLDLAAKTFHDEPGAGLESVLTLQLLIESDLEPQWTLWSKRAEEQGESRNIRWSDRLTLAPTRLGALADNNLSWRRGSILNRVSDDKIEAASALAQAARDARESFGDELNEQLEDTLTLVDETAKQLGITSSVETQALLDAYSISFSGGAISLHNSDGVPLKNLGLGSMRLLIAGLQRAAAKNASIVLVDEVEHGLEPHRIMRLLDALGAKEADPAQQVFMTTHSPVALRELSGHQLHILRSQNNEHVAHAVGTADAIQGTIRLFPEALLAPSILVCEGASEIGLVRGLDQYRFENAEQAVAACGVAIVNGGGKEMHQRALAFQALGYRVALLRDSDVAPPEDLEKQLVANHGDIFCWADDDKIEAALFTNLSDDAIGQLLDHAIERLGEALIDSQIKSASQNTTDLAAIQFEGFLGEYTTKSRQTLAAASSTKKNPWFKNISIMEDAPRSIIAPDLDHADRPFTSVAEALFNWVTDAGQ